ncbi:MAG: metal ABC transporter substrate-binding protein [Lachnospiraceae bacterium]|nr:metal ABC transporter substrate-binding protein [Lachnospiraceae bacterium]
MKKKVIYISILVLLASLLGGCQRTDEKDKVADTGRISIVTTIFPPYDFTKAVGGDDVEVTMLLSPGVESHSYEPTPQDIIKINESDLFIYVGGESDAWVEGITDSLDQSVKTMTLMDCVDVVEEEHVEGMEAEHEEVEHVEAKAAGHGAEKIAQEDQSVEAEDTVDAEYDEHVWTSPKNANLIVNKIAEELITIDAEHKEQYQQNLTAYEQQLEELDQAYEEVVSNAAGKELIFGDRFPFRYLTDAYGLSYYAAFPGCSSETEPSAATVAFLTNKVKEDKIPVVLYLELSNHKIADAIAEATGTRTEMLHSCHNISKDEVEAGVTYLSLMKQNLEVLKGALQ